MHVFFGDLKTSQMNCRGARFYRCSIYERSTQTSSIYIYMPGVQVDTYFIEIEKTLKSRILFHEEMVVKWMLASLQPQGLEIWG